MLLASLALTGIVQAECQNLPAVTLSVRALVLMGGGWWPRSLQCRAVLVVPH